MLAFPNHGKNTSSTEGKPFLKGFPLKLYKLLVRQLLNIDSVKSYVEPIVQQFFPEWRSHAISAKVTGVRPENDQIFSLILRPNKTWNSFTAGQFIQLTVKKEGALVTRTFSIASSPRQFRETGEITLTIRVQDSGAITPWLKDNLKTGNTVYISQAAGEFTLKNSSKKKVFIAGGSGLTPIHSMLRQSINSDWFSSAHLMFYTLNRETAFYHQEIDYLRDKGISVHHIFSDEQGYFSEDHLQQQQIDLSDSEFYICGPQAMIDSSVALLKSLNVEESNIYFEYFGSPSKQISLSETDLSALNADETEHESIYVDYLDSRKQVKYSPDTFLGSTPATLLDAAEQEGLNPVSGCRMGVCHQCICKKKNGRVLNTKTGKVSDSGEEEIQLCVSIPVSPVELEL